MNEHIYFVKNLLIRIWREEVKREYEQGLICSERHLQAFIFMNLRQTFTDSNYEVWVEPKLWGEVGELKGTRPDVIITYDNVIILLLELKYVPFYYVNYHNDILKLSTKLENLKTVLFTKANTGDWDYTREISFDPNCLIVLAVIAMNGAAALSNEHINLGQNSLHLFGSIGKRNDFNYHSWM